MVDQIPLLSTLIWLPILAGTLILLAGPDARSLVTWIARIGSAGLLFFAVMLYQNFDPSVTAFQFQEVTEWIKVFNINYALGVDGFAVPLIALTAVINLIVVVAAEQSVKQYLHHYLAAFLIMAGMMNGVFAAMDAVLFYVFFEGMLIPMLLIIGVWGGPNRVYASIKFFLYTFIGSILMLVALIYLGLETSTFMIATWQNTPLSLNAQIWIFLAFFIAFAVKVPMWPVHTWLPDAHVEAPTGGSVVLAAIMLKIGTYGFIRFNLPVTPDAASELSFYVICLSLVAVCYIGFVALAQKDMKKLIAYSSIAHMGFVTLGLFVAFMLVDKSDAAYMAIQGAMVQMISHGFISGAMFLCVGVLYDRMHSRDISSYGGVANVMPKFAALFMLFAMANAGLPGTSGFVGEFMVILASFQANVWFGVLASMTLILGAAYTLWMYKRVLFGDVKNDQVAALQGMQWREVFTLSVLALFVLFFGLYPNPLIEVMQPSVEVLVNQGMQSKLIG